MDNKINHNDFSSHNEAFKNYTTAKFTLEI